MKKIFCKENVPELCIIFVWNVLYVSYVVILLQHWENAAIFASSSQDAIPEEVLEEHFKQSDFLVLYTKFMYHYILFALFVFIVRKKWISLIVFAGTGILIGFAGTVIGGDNNIGFFEPMRMLYYYYTTPILIILAAVITRFTFLKYPLH